MSLFGKNIRKIRSLKSMSQHAFADLFDLKRGTLGAYEEGRSEPKIDTIIKIANYFSIPIDHLLTKELTVNELLKFRGGVERYNTEISNQLFFKRIPCIPSERIKEYSENFNNTDYIENIPYVLLPITEGSEMRSFIINNLEMSKNNKGFYPKDVVIGSKVDNLSPEIIQDGKLYITVLKEEVIFRRIFISNTKITLRADHPGVEDIILKLTDIKELWRVDYVFYHRTLENNTDLEDKIMKLEEQFKQLKSEL
ncbi:helix-turn-helix domain-containing protein [Joostella sp.]|uniref:helix-turn-helix domain-containing protein n=1 Tax=Joostella sp. TaxID=2231138 RepID=UPI003A8CD884